MTTVAIKIEQMYPNRKLIEEFKWNDLGRTTAKMAEEVERYIKQQMNIYRHKFPEMTELRWEFADIGQGHYIQISDKPLSVYVGRLTLDQLHDVLKKAINIRDWQMAENVCYQLKLMGDFMLESYADFELPYAVYEFDWMFYTDDDEELIDNNIDLIANAEASGDYELARNLTLDKLMSDFKFPEADDDDNEVLMDNEYLTCIVCSKTFFDVPDEAGCNVCKKCSDTAELLASENPSFDDVQIEDDCVVLTVVNKQFVYTREYIDQVLSEGWSDDETMASEVDDIRIELTVSHFKVMQQALSN